MFGLFKNNMHRADHEIDSFALMVSEEGHIFAEKVVGNLPIDYDENQMLSFLLERNEKSKTYSEYIKECEISFEFSWFMLEDVSRQFSSAELRNIGDYVHQRMTENILDIYTNLYSSFMENKKRDINLSLGNMLNERTSMYSKLHIYPYDNKVEIRDTVVNKIAFRVCRINKDVPENMLSSAEYVGLDELNRVYRHLHVSALQDKFTNGILDIKNKLKT
jgi:hypothetical protein